MECSTPGARLDGSATSVHTLQPLRESELSHCVWCDGFSIWFLDRALVQPTKEEEGAQQADLESALPLPLD